MIFIYCNCVST